jgi:dihydroorotate dehydrogenase electron transfer subunit
MIQETGVVLDKRRIRSGIFSLTLELPGIAKSARPGQFAHLLLQNTPGVLLRRPFSIASVHGSQLRLLIRIVGTGTRALSDTEIGSAFDVIGPLGSGFNLSKTTHALLVAGGIGVAPLLLLQDVLTAGGAEVHFFLGARSREELPLDDDEIGRRKIACATDDGSFGRHGLISQFLEEWLSAAQEKRDLVIFSCGPAAMLRAVQSICADRSLRHQVSLENRMACGIGICQGCAVRMKAGFRLVCKDGPVFDAAEVDWSAFSE